MHKSKSSKKDMDFPKKTKGEGSASKAASSLESK